MMKRFALLGPLLGVLVAGCDGYLGMQGRVYEAEGLASASLPAQVLIDTIGAVLPPRLRSVAACKIAIEPWAVSERSQRDDDGWVQRTVTDNDGYFRTGQVAAPGWYDATLTVMCPGRQLLVWGFRHDRQEHHAIIVVQPSKR